MIRLTNVELLGGNQVKLSVSDDYLAFAEKNFISDFIDFSWMKTLSLLIMWRMS